MTINELNEALNTNDLAILEAENVVKDAKSVLFHAECRLRQAENKGLALERELNAIEEAEQANA